MGRTNGSSRGSRRRGAAAVCLGVLLVAAGVAPASAGATKSGTITPTFETRSEVALGDWVSFDATWSRSVRDPRIGVECRQDGALVYVMFTAPEGTRTSGSASLQLGGGSSAWLANGGPADCVGWLKDYVGAPSTKDIVPLAEVTFVASG